MRKTIITLAALILSACSYPGAIAPTGPAVFLTVDDLQISPTICKSHFCLNRSVTFYVTGNKDANKKEVHLLISLDHRNAVGQVIFFSKIINLKGRVPFSWKYEFRSFEEGSLKVRFSAGIASCSEGLSCWPGVTFIYEGGQ